MCVRCSTVATGSVSWAVLGWNTSDTTHGHGCPAQEGLGGEPAIAVTSGGSPAAGSSGLRGARPSVFPPVRRFFHRVQDLCLRSVFPLNRAALKSDVPISSVVQASWRH